MRIGDKYVNGVRKRGLTFLHNFSVAPDWDSFYNTDEKDHESKTFLKYIEHMKRYDVKQRDIIREKTKKS